MRVNFGIVIIQSKKGLKKEDQTRERLAAKEFLAVPTDENKNRKKITKT